MKITHTLKFICFLRTFNTLFLIFPHNEAKLFIQNETMESIIEHLKNKTKSFG